MTSTAEVLKLLFAQSRQVTDASSLIEGVAEHLVALPDITRVALFLEQTQPPHQMRARASRGLTPEALEALALPEAVLPQGLQRFVVPLTATPERVTLVCDGPAQSDTPPMVATFLALALERDRAVTDALRLSELFGAGPDVLLGRLEESHKLQAVGTLASGIAHDFNNVLAAILAHLELARLEPAVADNADVVAAMNAAMRGRDVVRQLLVFGRSPSEERTPYRLQRIIEDSMGMIRSTIPSPIGLRLSLDPKAPEVLVDPQQLQQVLVNLVTLAAHAITRGTVELSLVARADNLAGVELTVTSEGPGLAVAPDERALGLSVVRTIVKTHGGTLALEPRRAVVWLPAAEHPLVADVMGAGGLRREG